MIRKNIIANMIGRAWGFISVYFFVPLYLKFLGIEAYGLVGFYSTLLGVLAFADMGFTATLNREMARLTVCKNSAEEMRDLLRTYELTYLCISFTLAVIIWVTAPLIATHWLRSSVLHPQEITAAVRLMGVAIAFQLPSGLYIGGLMGLQQQVRANSLQIAWGVYRGFGAVLVLWLFSPTIFSFAIWQLVSNGIYCFSTRRSLWHTLSFGSIQPHANFRWQVFHNTWRYASGMAGMAVVSILLTQIDKLAVSKMLSLEMLGFYTLAASLAAIPLILASPIASAVFPRFTELIALGGRSAQLTRLYHQTCELASIAIIPAGLTIAIFSNDVIYIWTGSAATANQTSLVASLLLGGQLLQAITVVPYYLALAHGNIRLNLHIGIASLILITPLLIFLIMKFGIVGAGFSWLVMNLCTVLPYMYLFHRRFLPCELQRWCVRSVGRPLLVALPCILLGRWLLPDTTSRLLIFCFIGLIWGGAVAAAVLVSSELRQASFRAINRSLGFSYGK
jgi:O-antigen/teichoic acid export membrane protein